MPGNDRRAVTEVILDIANANLTPFWVNVVAEPRSLGVTMIIQSLCQLGRWGREV